MSPLDTRRADSTRIERIPSVTTVTKSRGSERLSTVLGLHLCRSRCREVVTTAADFNQNSIQSIRPNAGATGERATSTTNWVVVVWTRNGEGTGEGKICKAQFLELTDPLLSRAMFCHCIHAHSAAPISVERDTTVFMRSEIRQNASLLPTIALLILDENVSVGCRPPVGPEYLNSMRPSKHRI